MISWTNLSKAESAVNALRFSGLLLEEATYLHLLATAQRMFPQERLVELASQERIRERERKTKTPPSTKLLQSFLLAIFRHGGSSGMEFVHSVEDSFQGTAVPAWIESFRGGS